MPTHLLPECDSDSIHEGDPSPHASTADTASVSTESPTEHAPRAPMFLRAARTARRKPMATVRPQSFGSHPRRPPFTDARSAYGRGAGRDTRFEQIGDRIHRLLIHRYDLTLNSQVAGVASACVTERCRRRVAAYSIDGLNEKSDVVTFAESPSFAFSASTTRRDRPPACAYTRPPTPNGPSPQTTTSSRRAWPTNRRDQLRRSSSAPGGRLRERRRVERHDH